MKETTSSPVFPQASQSNPLVSPPARRRIVPVARENTKIVQPRSRRASFKKVDLTRAIMVATTAGLVGASFEITAEGTIRILAPKGDDHANLFDQWQDKL